MTAIDVRRSQVLAYRAHVHGLEVPDDSVLGVGVQDNPPGRSAYLALHARMPDLVVRDSVLSGELPLVYAARGAMHVHRATDLGLLTAALRFDDNNAPALMSFGPFGTDLAEQGVELPSALIQVADAMRQVVGNGTAWTKGELSGAVTPLVDSRIAPWCEGCGVFHVHDGLWRYATLQAGLRLIYDESNGFRLVRATVNAADRDESRRTLVTRFLHLSGPAAPSSLAAWLGLTNAAARRWWRLVEDDLVPVSVDGARLWIRSADLGLLRDPPSPRRTVLLPPYDPITELADRALLVPDKTVRKQVWPPTAKPGVLLVDGQLAGTWRQRTRGKRLDLTITRYDECDPAQVEADARHLSEVMGLDDAVVHWATSS